jgi:hypothetical protein
VLNATRHHLHPTHRAGHTGGEPGRCHAQATPQKCPQAAIASTTATATPATTLAKPTMQTPAKPVKKAERRAPRDQDYSTAYLPPAAPVVLTTGPASSAASAPAAATAPRRAPPKPAKPGQHTRPTRPNQHMIDPGALQICADPLPGGHWSSANGKYWEKFDQLKPGEALRCNPADVPAVSHALRKYLGAKQLKGMAVRTMRNYGDGFGRVWLMGVGA